jgi:hypothetical protein
VTYRRATAILMDRENKAARMKEPRPRDLHHTSCGLRSQCPASTISAECCVNADPSPNLRPYALQGHRRPRRWLVFRFDCSIELGVCAVCRARSARRHRVHLLADATYLSKLRENIAAYADHVAIGWTGGPAHLWLPSMRVLGMEAAVDPLGHHRRTADALSKNETGHSSF